MGWQPEGSEGCDDGNKDRFDGCDHTCQVLPPSDDDDDVYWH
jgi:cysteine-rich repeat protein